MKKSTRRFRIASAFVPVLGHETFLINVNEPLLCHSFGVVSAAVIGVPPFTSSISLYF